MADEAYIDVYDWAEFVHVMDWAFAAYTPLSVRTDPYVAARTACVTEANALKAVLTQMGPP